MYFFRACLLFRWLVWLEPVCVVLWSWNSLFLKNTLTTSRTVLLSELSITKRDTTTCYLHSGRAWKCSNFQNDYIFITKELSWSPRPPVPTYISLYLALSTWGCVFVILLVGFRGWAFLCVLCWQATPASCWAITHLGAIWWLLSDYLRWNSSQKKLLGCCTCCGSGSTWGAAWVVCLILWEIQLYLWA